MKASKQGNQPGVGIWGLLNLYTGVVQSNSSPTKHPLKHSKQSGRGCLFIKFHSIFHILIINPNENYIRTNSNHSKNNSIYKWKCDLLETRKS